MKITYEFDTDKDNFYESGDSQTLYRMQIADDMALCLENLREKVRGWIKYDNREQIPKDEIEDTFWEIIKDHGINFEKLGY